MFHRHLILVDPMQRPVIGPRQRDKIAAPYPHKLRNQEGHVFPVGKVIPIFWRQGTLSDITVGGEPFWTPTWHAVETLTSLYLIRYYFLLPTSNFDINSLILSIVD